MKCRSCFVFVLFKKPAALRSHKKINSFQEYHDIKMAEAIISSCQIDGMKGKANVYHLQRTEHKNVTRAAINLRFIQLLKPLIF